MSVNPSEVFNAIATPSPELQRLLAYHAENGSVLTGIKSRPDKDDKNKSDRDDLTTTSLQITQERIYQQFKEQSERVNQAIELALAEAATPEERQEIIEYQELVQEIDEDIEQKREEGILTQGHIEHAEQAKMDAMPKSVQQQLPSNISSANLEASEFSRLEKFSGTSFTANVDDSSLDSSINMNLSFQNAASGQTSPEPEPTDPDIAPVTPSDLSKFTI